jgi:hypothetical protein
MRRYILVIAAVFVVSLASWSVAADTTTSVVYPHYRNAYAYFINGETKQILFQDTFGAVVYSPLTMGNHTLKVTLNETKIETSSGTIRFARTLSGVVDITYPGGSAKIESALNEIRLRLKDKTYSMKRQMNDFISIEVPGDVITYKTTSGRNEMTVSGKAGTATYKRNLNDFTITSKAGTTKYSTVFDGGYSLSGVPAGNHPYRYWGVVFLIPEYQIGIVMELGNYISIEGFPRMLDFERALIVK